MVLALTEEQRRELDVNGVRSVELPATSRRMFICIGVPC